MNYTTVLYKDSLGDITLPMKVGFNFVMKNWWGKGQKQLMKVIHLKDMEVTRQSRILTKQPDNFHQKTIYITF